MEAEPPKRKRSRFQFRLRTLLIAVTLLAVACAYVGWQARDVRHRQAVFRHLKESGAWVYPYDGVVKTQDVSWIRKILGDQAIYLIILPQFPQKLPADTEADVRSSFPEAIVQPIEREDRPATKP